MLVIQRKTNPRILNFIVRFCLFIYVIKCNTFALMETKKTALTNTHVALGAKMAPFGGYEMPIQYQGVKIEHQAVRASLGVFDVSHMGEFFIKGPHALTLLQRVCSNAVDSLAIGKAQYNYFPNNRGGVVDDLIVYRLAENTYFLVVNAANIAKDWKWIQEENRKLGATIEDVSASTSLLAIQGPNSLKAMQTLTDIPLETLPFYGVRQGTFASVPDAIVATTGYTGAGGIEVYFPNTYAEYIWDKVMDAGSPFDIQPIGLAARDTLRLEMGYCLYGHEIDDKTNPIAAGLGWITKPHASNLAHAWLTDQKAKQQDRLLVGFEIIGRGIPRAGYSLTNASGDTIGQVTSGTQSPSLNTGIGLGFVKKEYTQTGQEIFVHIRGKEIPAKITKLPFYKAE